MSNLGIIRNPRWKIRNRQADPDPIPDPTYENAMRNADFPQWQCAVPKEFYGRFTSMPMHCQLAVWKESGMKTPFEVEAEENVQEVTNHKSAANPGPSAGPSEGARGEDATATQRAVHRLMTHALGSTRKPTTHTGEQTGDDGDDPIRVETHTSTAIISNRGEKGSGIGKPLETGWSEPSAAATLIDDEGQRRLAEEALNAVEDILWGDNPCADFFGGAGVIAFYRLKKQILDAKVTSVASGDKTGIEMSETKNNRTRYYDSNGKMQNSRGVTTAFRVFGKLAIHNRGPFFNIQSTARIGGYSAATIESRMAQILHELAHLIYKPYPGNELIPDDGGDASKSSGNTSTVLNPGEGNGGCKAEIDAIAKRMREVS